MRPCSEVNLLASSTRLYCRFIQSRDLCQIKFSVVLCTAVTEAICASETHTHKHDFINTAFAHKHNFSNSNFQTKFSSLPNAKEPFIRLHRGHTFSITITSNCCSRNCSTIIIMILILNRRNLLSESTFITYQIWTIMWRTKTYWRHSFILHSCLLPITLPLTITLWAARSQTTPPRIERDFIFIWTLYVLMHKSWCSWCNSKVHFHQNSRMVW